MPYIHDGTEDFGGTTAYWLRDPETGERIPVEDPLTAQEVAGPFQPATGPSAAGLQWSTPEAERDPRRQTELGKLVDAKAPDRRVAETRISLDPLAGLEDEPPAAPQKPAAALPENVTGALDAAAPRRMNASEQDQHDKSTGKKKPWQGSQPDEDGLVYLDSAAPQGQAVSDRGAQGQPGSPYYSQTPMKLPGLDVDPRDYVSGPTKAEWVNQSRETKGDKDTIAELRRQGSQLLRSQFAVAEAERDMKVQEAYARRQEGDLLRERNQAEQQRLQSEMAKAEDWRKTRLGEIDSDARDLASKKTDPNRWYTNVGPAGVILAAISRAAGTLGGTEDPGRIIDSFIAADIAQQEEDYRSAGESLDVKRNAFAREMQAGMDPEIARKKIELMQNTFAESLVQDREYQAIINAAGIDAAKLQNDYAEKNLKLRADLEALLGEKTLEKARQASAGGFNRTKYLQDRKLAAEVSQVEGEAYGVFPTQAERLETQKQQGKGGELEKDFRGQVERLGEKMSTGGVSMGDLMMARDQFEDSVRGLAEANGMDIPGTGSVEGLLPNLLAGGDGRKVRREAGRLTNFFLKRLSGAASPDAEVIKQMEQDLAVYSDMSASDEEVAAALQSTSSLIDSMAATRAAAFPPPVYQQWRQNLSDIRQEAPGRMDLLGRDSTFEAD